MSYQIESNVPIPPKRLGGEDPNGLRAVMRRMEVGQCVFVADPYKTKRRNVSTYARGIGAKFTSRLQDGGFRIWRIE